MGWCSIVRASVHLATPSDKASVICIDPPPVDGVPYKPWRLRDSPDAKKPIPEGEEAEEPQGAVSFDSRLAEAVVMYQSRILSSVTILGDKVERHNRPPEEVANGKKSGEERGKTGIKVIDGLERKVEVFESGEKTLQREMDAIHRELGEISNKIKKASVSRPRAQGIVRS